MNNVLKELVDSELKLYYLALATAIVAAFMGITFLVFKSTSTLVMMMSGILILLAAIIILVVAVYLDYIEGRFSTAYQYHPGR
ncbi:MAG: hypothetical protein SCH39_10865 [Methanosarcinales archaeon]|nr:hypothetical protein [ANME-2 cluster archaeon]MDF1532190.1 hypothetical protein [ANME-2 cluster archaeon]MDW7776819.1 hypothetical protein [Methanosarcinales archaeon]